MLAKTDADLARLYDERLVAAPLRPLGERLRQLLADAQARAVPPAPTACLPAARLVQCWRYCNTYLDTACAAG